MRIFVFGSNLKGIHGKGAALHAFKNHGAVYGQGEGLQGKSYAIPTKRGPYEYMPLPLIEHYVINFINFAKAHPEYTFDVTRVGCGLAGYTDADIAPMFSNIPINVILPIGW